jgi:hypothetical protein
MSPPMLCLRGGVEPHPVGSPAGVKITEAGRQPAAPSPPGYSNGNVSYSARAFVRTGVDMSSNVVRNSVDKCGEERILLRDPHRKCRQRLFAASCCSLKSVRSWVRSPPAPP